MTVIVGYPRRSDQGMRSLTMRELLCYFSISLCIGLAWIVQYRGAPKSTDQRYPKTILEKIGEAGDQIACFSQEEVSAAPLEKARFLTFERVLPDEKAWARIGVSGDLEVLTFGRMTIPPDVFARLAGLKSLRYLQFSGCKIPLGAWANLKETEIEELGIVDMTFDDAALESVSSMPRLRWLMIGCPNVTFAARDRFKKAHANIKLTLIDY